MYTKKYGKQIISISKNLVALYKWFLLILLIVTELAIFAWLHAEPMDPSSIEPIEGSIVFYILFGNLRTCVLTILMGTISLGIGTFLSTYFITTYLVSQIKYLLSEVSVISLILCTLPHGIFEFPSIILSIFLSALWSRAVTLSLFRVIRRKPVLSTLRNEIKFLSHTLIFIQFPLIITAAIIESTISNWITAMFL